MIVILFNLIKFYLGLQECEDIEYAKKIKWRKKSLKR